jgi:DNA-binding CsgD family transcriptional regulator
MSDRLSVPGAAIPLLTRWGVSADADLVFRALTEFGAQRPAELAGWLGLSARRLAAALDELATLGAAVPAPAAGRGDEALWFGRSATEVIAGLRRHRQRLARRHVPHALSALHELGADCRVPADQLHTVRPLTGAHQVRARLAELITATRSEFLAMQPDRAFSAEAVAAAAPQNRSLLRRGLRVLALGVPPATEDAAAAHSLELLSSGLQYREQPALPTKLIVVDRRIALVPLDPGDPALGALEIPAVESVHALVGLFLRQWAHGQEPWLDDSDAAQLAPRERAVVNLLAAGYTDAGAASRLGLSRRTVAYTVSGLIDRFGVHNRFQLGLVLGAAGVEQGPTATPGDPDDAQ